MGKIWTIDARDTVFFDAVMESTGLSHADLGPEIRALHAETVRLLATKGIAYEDLRAPLVPHTTTHDIALLFDTEQVESGAYGLAVATEVLPLIDRKWRGSILVGDLVLHDQDLAISLLKGSRRSDRGVDIRDSSQLYAVYLSNLSRPRIERLITGLGTYTPFVGYLPATYSSRTRDWLSATLVNRYLKFGDTFIGGHEDDVEGAHEYNLGWWPLEEHGYRCVSVPGTLHFDLFLSYKIERAVFPGFESDTLHGLSSIASDLRDLGDLNVFVDPPKVGYLRGAKGGLLGTAGLTAATAPDYERLIAAKVQSTYIYELEQLVEHGVSKFSVMIEVDAPGRSDPVRLVAALAYEPDADRLRLITLSA